MWFIYALFSIFAFGVLLLIQKITAQASKNFRVTAVAFNLTSAGLAILIFLISGGIKHFQIPSQPMAYVALVAGIGGYGLYERLRFKVAAGVEASQYAILANSSVIVAFFLSLFLYHETLNPLRLLGTALIIFALGLASWEPNTQIFKGKALLVIYAESILGVAMAFDKMGAQYFSPEVYNIALWVLPLGMIIFPLIPMKKIKLEFVQRPKQLLGLAVLNVLGYFAALKAFTLADATKVIPVLQTCSLLTVLLGIIFLKETRRLPIKIFSAILGLLGIVLLS